MKLKSLKFVGLIGLLAIVGAVAFTINVSFKPIKVAAYSQPTCSDGASSCGSFGAVIIGTVSCSINGRANDGWTATCNTADGTTVVGGIGQQEWLAFTKSGSLTVPATYTGDANYNGGSIFPNSSVSVTWGANQSGSVSLGTLSDSNDPCSPYAIGKNGCNGFSGRTATGTASPGDTLNMTVTMLHADNNMNSTCTVGGNCGQWGAGSAFAEVDNATYCYKSTSSSNTNYIVPGDPTSGKRNYVATAQGVCTPNNVSAAVPKLSAKFADGTTNLSIDTNSSYCTLNSDGSHTCTIPFTFWNSGQSGSLVNVTGCNTSFSGGLSEVPLTRVCQTGHYTK